MKLKKKAFMFEGIMFFVIFIILTTAFLTLYKKQSQFPKGYSIGERQFSLIKIYQKAENTLFYLDQSAKYSLQQAVYELAQNGGVTEFFVNEEIEGSETIYINNIEENQISKCGKFKGTNIWYKLEKDDSNIKKIGCFDEKSAFINLESLFNKKFNEFLINHPENILLDNYNYEIKDGLEITGRAIEPLRFYILKMDINSKIEETPIIKAAIKEPREKTTEFSGADFTGTQLCAKGTYCALTQEAYELLLKAENICLKKGEVSCLEVTSAYRSIEKQTILWNRNPNSKYVCPPSPTCPHTTGKVVDIRFKDKTRATMQEKDWKLLHDIMNEAGWIRYSNEPWHFECCGTQRYARAKEKGVTAIV